MNDALKAARSNTPRIDTDRLWARHMELARIGIVEDTGNCRLALSPEDVAARDLFAGWCRNAGLTVHSDRAGNMFALRQGRDSNRPPVAAGSHLDTQPHGGRFDGISGVLAALEVVEALNDAGIETEAPLAVINWTNEEGVRFAPGLLGSAWYAGRIGDEELDNIMSSDGTRFADDVQDSGWRGDMRPADLPLDSFFELHIEQGPILYDSGAQVGVVTSVQGLRWLDVAITGRDGHAGTTPLDSRQDALLAAGAILVALRKVGIAAGADARVSVGRLTSMTDGPSTIAGHTDLVIDIRHPDKAVLARLEEDCTQACHAAAREYGCKADVSRRFAIPPRNFDGNCVSLLETAARKLDLDYVNLPSGALHDASNIAELAPTAMVFVQCREGISHNVQEYAAPQDLAAGASVLLHAMLERAGIASVE
ncbi:N-carbamoyl-L-amino-acid hydrolase [Lutimaribacter pacificus]|uniref:N-carbamoyl-L-amino-acid hydrolase n=1 Tax=Lutimaribacter pacificus TaxID=391948 RepID=A0A1H0L3Z9_9RHOB|nr:Zn-dependent hydrolase [Lutimaribacter pacificus]SDO62756.1 N-carbamoyl-L-amino-acid hydrolase [Lutimaribacter pacificus]SHK71201.1 N-carbamoyl-L-amino-acid hydrolase [Lutimaribacter pacificus]